MTRRSRLLGVVALLWALSIPGAGFGQDAQYCRHSCEPQEPYVEVAVTALAVSKQHAERTDTIPPAEVPPDIAPSSFRIIERTGEVRRTRACELDLFKAHLEQLDKTNPYILSQAVEYFKLHFRPSGFKPLNDSAFVELRAFHRSLSAEYINWLEERDPGIMKRVRYHVGLRNAPPNAALDSLVKTFTDNAYVVIGHMEGWEVNPDLGYFMDEFSAYLSRPLLDYSRYMSEQLEDRAAFDGRLRISFEELAERLGAWARLETDHPDFIYQEKVVRMREGLLYFFLTGYSRVPKWMPNSDSTSYTFTRKRIYETFVDEHGDTEAGKIVSEYFEVLRSSGFECTEAVERFLHQNGSEHWACPTSETGGYPQ